MPDLNTPRSSKRHNKIDQAEILRRIEGLLQSGIRLEAACRTENISVPSFYRWRAHTRAEQPPSARIKQKIIAAAEQKFLRHGYGASLDEIASAARVARQTVYNQFGSKDRLFADIVQSVFARITEPASHVDPEGDFIETMTSFGRAFMKMAFDPESIALQRMAMGEYRHTPDLARQVYAQRASREIPIFTDLIAAYLRAQMSRGIIDEDDPILLAEAFAGSFTLHTRHRLLIGASGDSPERQEAMLKLSVKIFAKGLGYGNPHSQTAHQR